MLTRVYLFAILFAFLFSFSYQICLKQNCNRPKPKTSYINFNVDDVVTHFYVNGVEIPLRMTDAEAGNWLWTHTIAMSIYEGDTIGIKGKNKLGGEGMIGTIQFYDQNGVLNLYHTGPDWKCDNFPPVVKAFNDGKKWPFISCIDSTAQWIWTSQLVPIGTEVYCSYTIPYNIIK